MHSEYFLNAGKVLVHHFKVKHIHYNPGYNKIQTSKTKYNTYRLGS